MIWTVGYGVHKNLKTKLLSVSILTGMLVSLASPSITPLLPTAHAATITNHVVINEIFPSPSSGSEWIELYNPTSSTVDLTGWKLKDSASYSKTLSGTLLAGGFVTFDVTSFNNSGDTARLNNSTDDIDTVVYGSIANGSSWARTYDASSDFEIRSDVTTPAVTKGTSNGLEPYVHQTSDSAFLSTDKYIRANTTVDVSGYVRVPGKADAVRFDYDGAVDVYDIDGYEHIQAGQWPSAQGAKQFRVKTPLPGGQYTITAEYRVQGDWYPVTGNGTVFVIDLPWAIHVTPSPTNQFFRTSDSPVRVRVDDQFMQFKHLITQINGTKFAVMRDQCDLRQAGNYLFCDVAQATAQTINGVDYPAWSPLPAGTYTASTTTFTKANNRVDDLPSQMFTIDDARPTSSNFVITNPQTVYGSSIDVTADATDDNGVKYVMFYLTAPRVSDGACDGNGTKLVTMYGSLITGSTYGGTFDTSGLDGYYCLNAVAGDLAAHHSLPILRIKVLLDNTAPVITMDPIADSTDTKPTITGTTTEPSAPVTVSVNGQDYTAAVQPDGTWSAVVTAALPAGSHAATASSTDDAGNSADTAIQTLEVLAVAVPAGNETPSEPEDDGAPAPAPQNDQNQGSPLLAQNTFGDGDAAPNQNTDDGEVEGATTSNEFASTNTGDTLGASTDTTAGSCGTFASLCWYYWPPIVIALLTFGYYLYGRRASDIV